ncbi:thermonuclease family protein [Candidatus Woesearchaeota archaeon]|nr:thermonuclease family protein [Candidatus Woesearchaeota archaeon]
METLDILLLAGRFAGAIAFLALAIAIWRSSFRTKIGLWMFHRFHHHHRIPAKEAAVVTIACLAIAVLLFPLPLQPEKIEIKCSLPYTVLNTACCLDMNNDSECDTPEELQPPAPECDVANVSTVAVETIKPERAKAMLYRAASIIDGDTFELTDGDKIRLLCIDAPERGELFYEESKMALARLVLNKDIILTNGTTDRDRYGRLLRYVYVQDRFVNTALVDDGYAAAYRPSSSADDDPTCVGFRESEQIARMKRFGMWGKLDQPDNNQSESIVVPPSPPYDCTSNRYDCDDFTSRDEAQDAYEACGGVENDIHYLDQDRDGQACEGRAVIE